jgi:hypothetical protein
MQYKDPFREAVEKAVAELRELGFADAAIPWTAAEHVCDQMVASGEIDVDELEGWFTDAERMAARIVGLESKL